MPNWKGIVTSNAKLGRNGGFECQNKKGWWLWTLKLEIRLWTSKLWNDDGSEHWTKNDEGSERHNWEDGGSERWDWEMMVALNAETKKRWWLWTPKLRNDGGFERRNWKVMVALNAETEKRWWLWMLKRRCGYERQNWEMMVALNAGTKKRWWLWMPNEKQTMALNAKMKMNNGFECQN